MSIPKDVSENEDRPTYQLFEHSNLKLANPTYWYDKQHPFELEFVVSQPTGVQKVFDNLVIFSNNAEPDSIEVTITGDNYDFGKDVKFYDIKVKDETKYSTTTLNDTLSGDLQYKIYQKCMNIKDWGRRIGNLEHKEDL